MSRFVIGIDPGQKGGIAVIDTNGSVIGVTPMPSTPQDIISYLRDVMRPSELVPPGSRFVCYMENVGHGMPGQSSKATATFARHCGHLDMALIALDIPTNTVTPNKWEKSYQLGNSREYSKTEWKNRLKAKAQQMFPFLGKKIMLSTCDALLLAEYGRKAEAGKQ